VRSELRKGIILDVDLRAEDWLGYTGVGGVRGYIDEAWHCGEYVGYTEGGEERWVLGIC